MRKVNYAVEAARLGQMTDYEKLSLEVWTNGAITPAPLKDWDNGDIGQRATSVLNGFVDYYRYTGDPAAIAHLTYMADILVDWCVTPPEHPWPGVFISVPVKGKAHWEPDTNGMIQLDISANMGQGLLRAYQVTGNRRWFDAAGRLPAESIAEFQAALAVIGLDLVAGRRRTLAWRLNLATLVGARVAFFSLAAEPPPAGPQPPRPLPLPPCAARRR